MFAYTKLTPEVLGNVTDQEESGFVLALQYELENLKNSERPWSKNHLVRLGKSIRDATKFEEYSDGYLDVMAHYQELSVSVQTCIDAACNEGKNESERLEVTSRAKSIDTLAEKLRRTPSIQLPAISDIAGVRIEGDMVLTEQDSLARFLCQLFEHSEDAIRDLRVDSHSGYRAVHLWLNFPAGRVEVQIRTALQGSWANAYEKAADVFGRGIRYNEYPDDPEIWKEVQSLQKFSTNRIAGLEKLKNDIWELEKELPEALQSLERLMARKTHRRKRIHKKRQKVVRDQIGRMPELDKRLALMKATLLEDEEQIHNVAKNLENAYMMMTKSEVGGQHV